jgi:DNA polymerase-1
VRVAAKFGIAYEAAVDWCKNEEHPDYPQGKKQRTKCKIFSFQRAYGAGAATIALETGMSVEEVEQLIEAEDKLYPGVARFNADVESAVIRSATPFNALNEETGQWQTYRRGVWVAPTGTRYSFRTHNAPAFLQKRGQRDSFSPPQLKNYPIQGFGGEVVQVVALGRLWRHFVSVDFYDWQAFLVNTVHDCVWADSRKAVRDRVCADIKRIMESIPEWYNTRYGMQIDVPFPAEVEVGPNMNRLKHWHPEPELALAA